MAITTISAAGPHASAAATDKIPASKGGAKGYLTPLQIKAYMFGGDVAVTAAGRALLAGADAEAQRATLELSDAEVRAVALGANIAVTAAGRAILDDADAAAQRGTLGLGTAALVADNTLVHLGGSETITGDKTFAGAVKLSSNYPVLTFIDGDSTSGTRSIGQVANANFFLIYKGDNAGAYVSDILKIDLSTRAARFEATPNVAGNDILTGATGVALAGSQTISGTKTFSAGTSAIYYGDNLFQNAGSNRWAMGRGAGGVGDDFAFYSYGLSKVALQIGYSAENVISNFSISLRGDSSAFNCVPSSSADYRFLSVYNADINERLRFTYDQNNVTLRIGIGGAPGTAAYYLSTTVLAPGSDNAISLGNGSYRWSTVYAATGTINTSDGRYKADIAPIHPDEALAFVTALDAKTFRRLDGRATVEIVESDTELEEYDVTETAEEIAIMVEDGIAKKVARPVQRPVCDEVPLFEADGKTPVMVEAEPAFAGQIDLFVGGWLRPPREAVLAQATISAPRKGKRPRQMPVERVQEGARTHAGFVAQEIAAALRQIGKDPAQMAAWGLVDPNDPDSLQQYRPDQLVPFLWAAVRGLAQRVAALEAA